jgi:hypothetical protein
MTDQILKRCNMLPNEIEDEICRFYITPKIRLQLLLQTYPLSVLPSLLADFDQNELNRIYKDGCVYKFLKGTFPLLNETAKKQFKKYQDTNAIAWQISPCPAFYYYWRNKIHQPAAPLYIQAITNFIDCILYFSEYNSHFNGPLEIFCNKVLCDLFVGILIMKKRKIQKSQ